MRMKPKLGQSSSQSVGAATIWLSFFTISVSRVSAIRKLEFIIRSKSRMEIGQKKIVTVCANITAVTIRTIF